VAVNKWICPSCGGKGKPAQSLGKGRQARCDQCGARLLLSAGETEDQDEPALAPRRREPKGRQRPLALILCLGGGFILLVVAAIVVLVWRSKTNRSPEVEVALEVTLADFKKIEIFMTRAQVEAVLGVGQAAGNQDMDARWVQAGQQARVTLWLRWSNNQDSVFVGFGQGRSGLHRAVVSYYMHKMAVPGGVGQETTIGFIHLDPWGSDLDDLALEKGKEQALLQSPRWRKGPAIRKAIVGFWVAIGVGSYQFKEDGACFEASSADKSSGAYHFTDDENVELTMKIQPLFPGQAVEPKKIRCKVLVDDEELILVDDRFPGAHPILYQRRK
jgi:DNA-directed RNA polymerase subunit RPC12/RpoP